MPAEPGPLPILSQINLAVSDLAASVEFYRRLGLQAQVTPDARHAALHLANGFLLELDTTDFVPSWNSGYDGTTGGSTVIGFSLPARQAVDDLYASLTDAGYQGSQPPWDAFWGARYAIVCDPDGNGVGLMSPVDEDHKSWPPTPPPRS